MTNSLKEQKERFESCQRRVEEIKADVNFLAGKHKSALDVLKGLGAKSLEVGKTMVTRIGRKRSSLGENIEELLTELDEEIELD